MYNSTYSPLANDTNWIGLHPAEDFAHYISVSWNLFVCFNHKVSERSSSVYTGYVGPISLHMGVDTIIHSIHAWQRLLNFYQILVDINQKL